MFTPHVPHFLRILMLCLAGILLVNCGSYKDPFLQEYEAQCTACHGPDLRGTPNGTDLLKESLSYGESMAEINKSIREGYPDKGMPAFAQTLTKTQIQSLAILISEKRAGTSMSDFKVKGKLQIPQGNISSESHDFELEVVAKGLHRWPYSIAPLPDGRILLTEKMKGLSLISAEGKRLDYIKGTPPVYDDGYGFGDGLIHGTGWMLDVALHPDYEQNGWIYLSFGDRCKGCNEYSRESGHPVSLAKLIRGRITDGQWIEEEVIWEGNKQDYTAVGETTTGGRICFDQEGHVFMSLGAKYYRPEPEGTIESYVGIQDLSQPYGKILRLNDDGSIPEDNPFISDPRAIPAIWTFGHRSPQGLEVRPGTNQLWGTEMGPRGGDELNLLLSGRNYGWPLHSKGVNYDGSPVDFGKYLGIAVDLDEIEQPVLDLTPSPAVSSFAFYEGKAFPHWQGNLLVGSLKATTLYRMVLEGDKVVHQEVLLKDLARIRDVEIGFDGAVYLLIEHASGARIIRLSPLSN